MQKQVWHLTAFVQVLAGPALVFAVGACDSQGDGTDRVGPLSPLRSDTVCECQGEPCTPPTFQDDCADRHRGCPESLEIWLRCARARQLSAPGREGYRIVRCGDEHAVGYNYGVGDSVSWLYGADGQLVVTHWNSDYGTSIDCGAVRSECSVDTIYSESLAAVSNADAGAADAGPLAPLPECAKL